MEIYLKMISFANISQITTNVETLFYKQSFPYENHFEC